MRSDREGGARALFAFLGDRGNHGSEGERLAEQWVRTVRRGCLDPVLV